MRQSFSKKRLEECHQRFSRSIRRFKNHRFHEILLLSKCAKKTPSLFVSILTYLTSAQNPEDLRLRISWDGMSLDPPSLKTHGFKTSHDVDELFPLASGGGAFL